MSTDVKPLVLQFIQENFMMSGDWTIPDSASFIDHHVVDSTGFLELITFIEQTFGIQVLDDEMVPENLDSLNSIERYVLSKRTAVPVKE